MSIASVPVGVKLRVVAQKQRLPSKIGVPGVIASEAKQSHHKYVQDCFVAGAPRNDIGMWQHELNAESPFWAGGRWGDKFGCCQRQENRVNVSRPRRGIAQSIWRDTKRFSLPRREGVRGRGTRFHPHRTSPVEGEELNARPRYCRFLRATV